MKGVAARFVFCLFGSRRKFIPYVLALLFSAKRLLESTLFPLTPALNRRRNTLWVPAFQDTLNIMRSRLQDSPQKCLRLWCKIICAFYPHNKRFLAPHLPVQILPAFSQTSIRARIPMKELLVFLFDLSENPGRFSTSRWAINQPCRLWHTRDCVKRMFRFL